MPTLHTLGYSGFTPETFVAKLQSAHIEVVIDVRRNPVSRKAGFSQASLSKFLKEQGLEYVHIPELGVPQSLRNELQAEGELGEYLHQFGQYLMTCDAVLDDLERRLHARSCCLMCLEKSPEECHRSVIARELQVRSNGTLTIVHLLRSPAGKSRTLEFDE